ncbi:S-adenosyl-L-methionine-dependent tRNA 4-demethylwyosine synthase TYW1 [Echinops telfairi]|uniref:S-adenosyl-L-methionine-dependent tRNA 4-demethylwyosine synthase TYW1 n=1 Tax=Echinops telfairi TaxID=9371 RepID=A0AC55CJP3_ECHTE|nr:S-adenosyl-L-methionine-dependent tRNA 4-demethylwyosine synthase TYW1 [Echinops telfairi]
MLSGVLHILDMLMPVSHWRTASCLVVRVSKQRSPSVRWIDRVAATMASNIATTVRMARDQAVGTWWPFCVGTESMDVPNKNSVHWLKFPPFGCCEKCDSELGPSLDTWDFSSPFLSLWINRFYIYLGFAFGIGLWICAHIVIKKQDKNPPEKAGPKAPWGLVTPGSAPHHKQEVLVSGVKIFYASQTGTAKGFAAALAEAVATLALPVTVSDLKDYDPDDHLLEEVTRKNVCAFLLATYTDGQPPESALWFCKWLEEAASDFRFGRTYLKGMRYAVFGLGNSAYRSHFNKHTSSSFRDPRSPEAPISVLSCAVVYTPRHLASLVMAAALSQQEGRLESCSEESDPDDPPSLSPVVDVEDLGHIVGRVKKGKKDKEPLEGSSHVLGRTGQPEDLERRAMITPALREALTKQGYQLIGSHSGVKLCRWTKSMLRGRGGCYKHTFYGIESHRCMEATPSLACANKCVFCWRHHTNPVGTEWRWKMDQPEMILKEAIENHQNMIKQFKGVPGVRADRFEEGLEVRHCALSLVGEPIMYPEINRFLELLHQREISSFLVTNAQFPAEIRSLKPVTQLYVSVDASTQDSLKKIDRPLFKDFWQRFLDSLRALAEKVDELQAYAELVSLGHPDFIEVKGVTYCGESSASSLTMANVPWHEEVVHFVQELVSLIPDYGVACEHEHSNCLLIAHKKFKVGGDWWTWIDYDRFQELIREYERSGGSKTFSAQEYMARTPPWALFGAHERGFDPKDTRHQRKHRPKNVSGC